jgi:hypothetical protein
MPVLQYQVAGPERLWPVELARKGWTLRITRAIARACGVGRVVRGAVACVKSAIGSPGAGRNAASATVASDGAADGPGGSTIAWKSAEVRTLGWLGGRAVAAFAAKKVAFRQKSARATARRRVS